MLHVKWGGLLQQCVTQYVCSSKCEEQFNASSGPLNPRTFLTTSRLYHCSQHAVRSHHPLSGPYLLVTGAPRPKDPQLTEANLISHDDKSTGSDTPEKKTIKRFHQEHDQYRHFLVTGDTCTKDRIEQNAKYDCVNRSISCNGELA